MRKRKQPECILQAINRPTRDTAESFMHKWSDTRDVRASGPKCFVEPPCRSRRRACGMKPPLNTVHAGTVRKSLIIY